MRQLARLAISDTVKPSEKECMMIVTATELKTNIGRYLDAVAEDEVLITENGRIFAKLSAAQDKQAILDSLVGITAVSPVSFEEARKERLARQ
jgi:prevent-host-death family protein